MNDSRPTGNQIKYAEDLMHKLGYDRDNVYEILGKDFDKLTRAEMSGFIDILKEEWEG